MQYVMALDQPKEDDVVESTDGVSIIIDPKVWAISVDARSTTLIRFPMPDSSSPIPMRPAVAVAAPLLNPRPLDNLMTIEANLLPTYSQNFLFKFGQSCRI
jgi:hypothetical protein